MKPENLLRPTAMTKPERASRWRPDLLIPLALAMILGATPPVHAGQNSSSQPGPFAGIGISAPALSLINDLVSADRTNFFVYQDSDSGFNHGFPSGFFPGGPVLSKIHLDTACVYDPASANGCTTDTTRLDRVRGTVMRVTFDPLVPGEFVGINIEEPENFGANPRGVGYDLRGATRVCIDAASPIPPAAGFKVQFAVSKRPTPFVSIPAQWTPMCFDLAALGLTSTDLSQVHFLFTIVSNDMNAPAGGSVLLDNIRFDSAPSSQQNALSFPLANQIFGVVPASDIVPGRVAIPPDQVAANLTTIYESSLTMLALLSSGSTQNANSAREIADAFVYALAHDNQGDPIPKAPDGSCGLHNGMSSGDLPLFNDQGPSAGLNQIRLSGFSIASNLCGPTHFCVVLDGATGGNNAFAILALAAAYRKLNDQRYLDAARTIGNWIYGNLLDTAGTGFGGYYLGYPDEGKPKVLVTGKSIENNADIFRAFLTLGDIALGLGRTAEATEWKRRAKIAGDFAMQLFDPIAGRFYGGTVPPTTPPSPGITPNGPQKGNDVINTFDFLDSQTFTVLALASSSLYQNAIDWRRPIQWMLNHFAQSITAGGHQFQGFDLVASPTAGPNGVAWEFTGQAIVAMRFVDALYGETLFQSTAGFYLGQVLNAQQSAPFADGRGLVAATLQDGDSLPPYQQCLSTPFQCIASRVGLAATAWAIFSDQSLNPFVSNQPSTTLTLNKTVVNDDGGTAITANFQAKIDGNNVAWGVAVNVDPGSYTVSEASLLTNYTASGWSGACAANGSVTIAPGQNLVCNITNNDNPPLLRVVKALLSGDTGRFDLQIDGSPPNSGSVNVGDGSTGFVPVKGGVAHTVSEAGNSTNLADYVVTIGGACASDGTITPVSGNNSYTCTITNTRKGLQPPDVSQARPERRYTVAA